MSIGPQPRDRQGSAQAPRETDSRENTSRAKLWQPASMLPDPTAREGWSFRWVRTDMLGQSDPSNVDRQQREWWEPCKAEDHPEIKLGGKAGDNIRVGGLMLMKRPIEVTVSHRQTLQEQTARQLESADQTMMKDTDGRTNMRFTKPERNATVSFRP